MPFDQAKVAPANLTDAPDSLGRDCRVITPASADALTPSGKYFKYFIPADSGNVTYVPLRGEDGATYTTIVQAGVAIQGQIRQITAADMTIHGWYD